MGWLLLRLLPLRLVSGRRGRHLPLSARGQLEGVLAAARDDFTAELNGAVPNPNPHPKSELTLISTFTL